MRVRRVITHESEISASRHGAALGKCKIIPREFVTLMLPKRKNYGIVTVCKTANVQGKVN